MYRKTEGSGEWAVPPLDKDLTFGRNFTLEGGVINDTIWANIDPYSPPPVSAIPIIPLVRRTLEPPDRRPAGHVVHPDHVPAPPAHGEDEQLQAPGTPYAQLHFEKPHRPNSWRRSGRRHPRS
jgi:hypothetical protein